MSDTADTPRTVLLAGANRGLGLGLVREYRARGWNVIATARDPARAEELNGLARDGRVRVEKLDVTAPADAAALLERLQGVTLDLLFIVAGQSAGGVAPVHSVSPRDAADAFIVNSYAPPVLAETLLPLLRDGAPVVFMTSVLGSLARSQGGMETYNATKAALNMFAIGFFTRHADRRVLLMHPGWVRTDMGGQNAPLDVETSARGMADTIASRGAGTGVTYLDYSGAELPW